MKKKIVMKKAKGKAKTGVPSANMTASFKGGKAKARNMQKEFKAAMRG